MITPAEIIARKNLVASARPDGTGITAAEWMQFKAGVKDRAFWVSRVESLKFVRTCRDRIADLLAGAHNKDGAVTSRAEVVSDIMRAARAAGIAGGTNRISDPGSEARANVIIDTNAGLAAGYADAMRANTYGARLAFPAQELIRIEEREVPRDWRRRWLDAGGRLYGSRMIALKGDPVWTAISRFGVPYPPFDFNSGMGVRDVSFDDAVALEVIKPGYTPPKDSPLKKFNADLRADMTFKNDGDWLKLNKMFGDQIRANGDRILWRQEAVKEAFLHKRHFELDLGVATPELMKMLPTEALRKNVEGKSFSLKSKWLPRRRDNGTNHYAHFAPEPDQPNNTPLTPDDLELLPILFREPDQVLEGKAGAFICVLHDGDGGNYCLILSPKKEIRVKTFVKLKKGVDIKAALNNEP